MKKNYLIDTHSHINMIESLEVRHIEGKGQWMLIKFTKLNN